MEIDVLNKLIQWVDILRTKDDFDYIKTKVLFEIIEGLIVRYIISFYDVLELKKPQFLRCE